MKLAAVLALVVATATVRADTPPKPNGPPPIFDKIRELYERGDYEGVRRELLELYQLSPSPSLLFALGQAELNLGNYEAAIDYYDKFIATNPSPEQVALAQQAIGAARIKLAEPKPDKPPPPPDDPEPLPPPPPGEPEGKRWTLTHTGLVAFGGAAVVLGTGLLLYSRSMGNDRSGTLSSYDRRVDEAHTMRWTGIGIASAGTLLIGVTVLW